MDFIKTMKKREFTEMILKTVAAIFGCFIAIILMEAMIYGITLNALKKDENQTMITSSGTSVAYCFEVEEGQYCVLIHNQVEDDFTVKEWCNKATSKSKTCTKDELPVAGVQVKEVIMRAPNAFELSLEGWHYAVMAGFVAIVGGYFAYRFIRLAKEYKKIEDEFVKTGSIEITNV